MVTLRTKNLGFSYKTKHVFKDISLEIGDGQILSLVGPNGAGKTTLLKCANRLLEPNAGTIEVLGRNLKSFTRKEMAQTIAYVPQASPSQFPITVFDAVMLGRRPYLNWKPTQHDIDMVMDIIVQLEMADMAMRDINELSGGERQKVVIAKAIVQEPRILLFDEPTTYLDLKYQLRIMEFIRALVSDKSLCAIITTHDLNLALRYSNQLAVLKDGGIIVSGDTAVLTEEVILDVYGVEAYLHQGLDRPFMVPLKAVK